MDDKIFERDFWWKACAFGKSKMAFESDLKLYFRTFVPYIPPPLKFYFGFLHLSQTSV